MPHDPANLANTAAGLRHTDQKRLLGYLLKLGAADPGQRAAAALQATELLQRKGLSWAALVPVGPDNDGDDALPSDWRAQALELAEHPALAPNERTYLLKIAGWRVPGAAALVRLRELAERVGIVPVGEEGP
jgi:hypothetical protein